MDFSNRNTQPATPAQSASSTGVGASGANNRRSRSDKGKWGRIGVVVAVAAVVVLMIALIVVVAVGNKTEGSYVDTNRLQAVFLNTGQVYFGKVKALNDKYFILTNIYYLQTANSGSSSSSTSASNNVTLVKLGCELHEPYDQMVINRQSVTFWENLQTGGQVAQAVSKFQQQNPNGQKCSDQSSSSGATTNATQPANSNSSSPSGSTTTTKP